LIIVIIDIFLIYISKYLLKRENTTFEYFSCHIIYFQSHRY